MELAIIFDFVVILLLALVIAKANAEDSIQFFAITAVIVILGTVVEAGFWLHVGAIIGMLK